MLRFLIIAIFGVAIAGCSEPSSVALDAADGDFECLQADDLYSESARPIRPRTVLFRPGVTVLTLQDDQIVYTSAAVTCWGIER